ncbi:EboA domain-containing protein [Flavisolibacter nicotianae]|uniref:EboA domain-containing protein n=1 Tax=Flavisolibacter nicotianae TaxID=2364882 RepID=UPI001F089147|nr:EboA domain-containing protein [Flavisolibacter nicotianae]
MLADIIRQNVSADVWQWMEERTVSFTTAQFNTAFALLPRKTGKAIVRFTDEQDRSLQSARPGFVIRGWTIDRLARVWLLLQLDASEKESYFQTIENLFPAAEMQELVALYSALPVLAYPEMWTKRCAEGIRSNIGDVLQAIMCNNPYPSENLSEAAWNQLVLKAFFTEKPIHQINGLDKRCNAELAGVLSDYAHERWAAGRPVNPQLWRCAGKFINEKNFPDIERIAFSENAVEREAAALACWDSNYSPAKDLLNQNKELKAAIETGELTWQTVAGKATLVHP